VRGALATLATVLLLTAPALAQQPAPARPDPPPAAPGAGQARPPTPAERRTTDTLEDDPAVRRSQDAQPTAQGTRAPTETGTDTRTQELSRLLWVIWNEPVDLQGNPIVGRADRPAAPGPAAATARGCGTTSHELAARPAGSPAACPEQGDAPTPR
jgi:hypothetical protein